MKKFSSIVLYVCLGLSVVWAILLALGAFGVLNLASVSGKQFNYVWALIIVVAALGLYIALMFIEKIRGLIIPEWFKSLFYAAFFVFTNVYYWLGWFHSVAGLLIFAAYIAILFNIASVSIFYNSQKDEKNIVKTTDKFLIFSCFGYASVGIVCYQLVSLLLKVLCANAGVLSSLAFVVAEISIMLFVNFVFALLFTLSLKRKKQFINNCLIKYNK